MPLTCAALLAVGIFHAPALLSSAPAAGLDPTLFPGVLIDSSQAKTTGKWTESTHTKPFVGGEYLHTKENGATITFEFQVKDSGPHHVLYAYTPGSSRCTKVAVEIESAAGPEEKVINQKPTPPGPANFVDLGVYSMSTDQPGSVRVKVDKPDGHVIADAVLVISPDELRVLTAEVKKNPAKFMLPAAKPKNTKGEKKEEPEPAAPPFEPIPATRKVAELTPKALDILLEKHHGAVMDSELVGDEVFLRRASLDIAGRQPTPTELAEFLGYTSDDRRAKAINRLLNSPDYGRNWANYWSDVIGSRQQEPQLTFHNYDPFENWLTTQINDGKTWDQVVYDILTASGKVGDNPQATFIAFHQANERKLAGETSRVFLAIKTHCAECHDHPFIDMPQETFHGLAAFFTRTDAKIPQNDSHGIEVKSKKSGEHKLSGKGTMEPTVLDGTIVGQGKADLLRRAALANWIVQGDNPYFAKAYVNRIWARLMGRGFCEPVDEIGEPAFNVLPEVHAAVADHFITSGYDHRSVMRVIMNTRAYQRTLHVPDEMKDKLRIKPYSAAIAKPLRGDEIFDSLVTAIGLPNVTPPMPKKTAAVRFPIPPKSTRDLVNDAFGYDPSFRDADIPRTMKQAMFMMNNVQLQKQINSDPKSGTHLAKLLAEEKDNQKAIVRLYEMVLARRPNDRELKIVSDHVAKVDDRGKAFEDVLWSLINSAEFVTRR